MTTGRVVLLLTKGEKKGLGGLGGVASKVGGKPEKDVPKVKQKSQCVCEERPTAPNTADGPPEKGLKNDLGLKCHGDH